jgi:hypothetical protein
MEGLRAFLGFGGGGRGTGAIGRAARMFSLHRGERRFRVYEEAPGFHRAPCGACVPVQLSSSRAVVDHSRCRPHSYTTHNTHTTHTRSGPSMLGFLSPDAMA